MLRTALLLYLAIACSVCTAAPPRKVQVDSKKPDEIDNNFVCETCRVFCKEYEKRMGDKKSDDRHHIAIDYARTNATLYHWSETLKKLVPPKSSHSTPVPDKIQSALTSKLLTRHSVEVVLHALHAAAHKKSPPRMRAAMCVEVWCAEDLNVCELSAEEKESNKNFGSGMTTSYRGFRRAYEAQFHNKRLSGRAAREAGYREVGDDVHNIEPVRRVREQREQSEKQKQREREKLRDRTMQQRGRRSHTTGHRDEL